MSTLPNAVRHFPDFLKNSTLLSGNQPASLFQSSPKFIFPVQREEKTFLGVFLRLFSQTAWSPSQRNFSVLASLPLGDISLPRSIPSTLAFSASHIARPPTLFILADTYVLLFFAFSI